MAVLIEAISIVCRADAIESLYPGGWKTLRDSCPNRTFCADGELIRVGFMSPEEARRFGESLEPHGLAYLRDRRAVDFVVVDQQRGLAAPCGWAEFGHVSCDGKASHQVAACRLAGSTIAQVLTPVGWKYRGSLSESFEFVPLQ